MMEGYSDEAKTIRAKRISESKVGKKLSADHKKSLSKSNARYWLGKERSEETRRKVSENKKGKRLTDEHKVKLSMAHIGHISPRRRKIIQINSDGFVINEFDSISKAADILGIKARTAISNVLSGRSNSCMGFIFKYKEA